MTLDQLQLAPTAKKAADFLLEMHPYVIFTSGRRDAQEQCHAMACNVVTDFKWIMRTYIRGATLQTAVDQYRRQHTMEDAAKYPWNVPAIESVLSEAMHTLTDAELGSLSRHFTGDAFDVQPIPGQQGQDVLDTLVAMKRDPQFGIEKVLFKEGDLIRWHVQCFPSVEV